MTRRAALRHAAATALALGGAGVATKRRASAANATQPTDALANLALPPDLGQSDLRVYVEATGHTLHGSFLDYWRATGGGAIYGNPISEPFALDGLYSQAFERGVFQYRPELLDTADPIIRLLPLGRLAVQRQESGLVPDTRRWSGGGAQIDPAWRPLDPTEEVVARIVAMGGRFIEATGHTIGADVLPWYTMQEGWFYLGSPLSEPLPERGTTAQWFDSGLVLLDADGPRLAPLGVELAPWLGIDTAPAPRADLPLYDEALFWTGDNPAPAGDPAAPGMRWVEVSIAEQRLWAYQGDTLVLTTLVSTGVAPNTTEQGIFHVRLKYPEQDMKGFTDATGEVLGFGEAPPGAIPYEVKAIPNVMYFDLDGEALHGTYWHSNFGAPMSHGCVNLPLDVAAWMYGWAPLGTEVWVHE